jgi:hypothetical protein
MEKWERQKTESAIEYVRWHVDEFATDGPLKRGVIWFPAITYKDWLACAKRLLAIYDDIEDVLLSFENTMRSYSATLEASAFCGTVWLKVSMYLNQNPDWKFDPSGYDPDVGSYDLTAIAAQVSADLGGGRWYHDGA